MTAEQCRDAIAALGLSQRQAARVLGVKNERTMRRYVLGESPIPEPVARLLSLLAAYPSLVEEIQK